MKLVNQENLRRDIVIIMISLSQYNGPGADNDEYSERPY